MATAGEYDVHVRDVVPKLTLTVRMRGLRWYMFRLRLGGLFVRLGAWISGSGFVIERSDDGTG